MITVQSKAHEQVIDITEDVGVQAASMRDGGIAEDLLTVLRGLVPPPTAYVHDAADHVRAHVLSALVGPSVSVPVRDGRLGLGRFQRIVLLEFEGPRERSIEVSGSWN
jgi:secondary thiamine-phosphate synthase enzyme